MPDLATPEPVPSVSPWESTSFPPEARDRLIVALDFHSAPEALALVDRLDGACRWFKVGLELFLTAGGSIVETLCAQGYSIFLDLKLHDIPNTVAGAIRSVAPLGAELLTIHASGGPAMLAAAAEAAASLSNPPRLLAVTVLTSLNQEHLIAIGVHRSPAQQALRLARIASANGIDGLVCSPEEAASLRAELPRAVLVTPGIRPAGSAIGDQQRIATPAVALASGASYLVVGRPITQANNPREAALAILAEMTP